MGCGAISKPDQSIWLNAFSGLYRYRVKVTQLEEKNITEFIHEDQFDEMPLTTLMNIIAFNEKDSAIFDANFISVHNKESDTFSYYIQRLVGIERNPKTGKEWIIYINKAKHTWDEVCQQNIRIHPQDNIVWILQNDKDIKM